MAGRRRSRNTTPRGARPWLNSPHFDPQLGESKRANHTASGGLRSPNRVLQLGENRIELYAVPVHSEFYLPIGVDDVATVMGRLPSHLFVGLTAVLLLGGSKRQISRSNCWGRCYGRVIHLHPVARKRLTMRTTRFDTSAHPQRAEQHVSRKRSYWIDERELRDFYLYRVLLHEIGHHVEYRRNGYRWLRSRRKEERFAEWFAAWWGKRLR